MTFPIDIDANIGKLILRRPEGPSRFSVAAMTDYQRFILHCFLMSTGKMLAIAKPGRQIGATTILSAMSVILASENKDQTVLFLSANRDNSRHIHSICRAFFIDLHSTPPVETVKSIHFTNGSKIVFSSNKKEAIVNTGFDLVICDDASFGYFVSPMEFYRSIQSIKPEAKIMFFG